MMIIDTWGIAMAQQTDATEQEIYSEVQKIISGLLKFDADSRLRIHKTVGTFFGFEESYPKASQEDGPRSARRNDAREPRFSTHEEPPSPKDFLNQKQPNTDVDRVACLAFYLIRFRDTPHFKTVEISKLNTEAAQIKFSNPSHAVSNATRSGLLADAPKGMKQLSAHGERYVDALPDRAAAREVSSSKRSRRPRKKSAENENTESN